MSHVRIALLSASLAATVAAQTAPRSPAAPPGPTTQAAALPARGVRAPKHLYFVVGLQPGLWRAQMPPGFLPAIAESGGRFMNLNGREDSYWEGGYRGPNENLIPAKLRLAVATLPPNTLYVFDEEKETWSTNVAQVGPIVAEKNKRRFREFSDNVRQSNPNVLVAFYGKLPDGSYWLTQRRGDAQLDYEKWRRGEPYNAWSLSHAFRRDGDGWVRDDGIGGAEGSAAFFAWRENNSKDTYGTRDDGTIDESAGLDDCVDVLTPSLYTFYRGDDGSRLAESIAESRRLAGGRKIYPFIWPAFHNSNKEDGGKPIPLDQWRMVVRRVLRQADGCVLWGADPVKHAEHIRIVLEEAAIASRLDGPTTDRAVVDATQPALP